MSDAPVKLTIVDVAYGGKGVARTDQGVVFVPGAFVGETVEVEIVERRKSFSTARLLSVLIASPDRIVPETECVPGMTYAALRYPAEVALKEAQLRTLLTRIGKFDDLSFLRPAVASPHAAHYRNKLTLHFDGHRLGYIGEDNRTIVDTPTCPLSVEPINAALATLREQLRTGAVPPALRALLRPPAAVISSRGAPTPYPRVVFRFTPQDGVQTFLYGTSPHERLTERLAGLELRVAPEAFFQINLGCAELLLAEFRALFTPCERVLDLYCGCGLFGFVAVQAGAKELFGIETTPSAVASAQAMAQRLGISGTYRCDFSEHLPSVVGSIPVWIVDPPRDGLSDVVRAHILRYLPERVVYISCGPDTLARDLKTLASHYRIASMRLFDFFPRTPHFETLTVLERC
ncbi:MAG: TRAM domain-containing protein [Kiritimatiellia bacterium]